MKTIRSFLAINLDLEVVCAIADEQIKLKEAAQQSGAEIKWIPPQNMHVTIRFLGQVTEPMVQAIKDNIEPVTRGFAPFELTAANLGFFPDEENPKIVWIGVDDPGKELSSLYSKVAKTIEEAGFKSDNTPFKSHITIGRVKNAPPNMASELVQQFKQLSFGVSKISDLICYQSDLKQTGADYHKIWRLPLLGRYRPEVKRQTVNTEEKPENNVTVDKEQSSNES